MYIDCSETCAEEFFASYEVEQFLVFDDFCFWQRV